MIFLWLSIICSTGIYLIFKIRDKLKANLAGIIILNYFFAASLGLASSNFATFIETLKHANWLPIAAAIGLLFVIMFFLIAKSTEKAGMTFTSIATRMSMVFPIFFSLFLFNESITLGKIFKIILTFVAVILAIYHKPQKQIRTIYALLPFILFIGSGSVDTLVKIAQQLYVPDTEIRLFSSMLFATSFAASLILLVTHKTNQVLFSKNTLLMGLVLGSFNFGSLFFLMKALNNSGLDSSMVFGINNLAIVCLSLTIGFFIFKEKLSSNNWLGIALSLICILLLIKY